MCETAKQTSLHPAFAIKMKASGGCLLMTTVLLLCFIIVLAPLNMSQSQSVSSLRIFNGKDWNKWNHEKKVSFIVGFMCGSDWVASNSIVPDSLFPDKGVHQRAKVIWNEVVNEVERVTPDPKTPSVKKYSATDVFLFSMFDSYKKNDLYNKAIIKVSSTDIVSALNLFYSDPSNLKVVISNAVYLIHRKLKGAPSEDINILLPYLRGEKKFPPGWIIPVYDKNGKFVKII